MLIIIQNYDEVLIHGSSLIQTLKSLPGRHGSITDDRDDLMVLSPQAARLGHAQSCRDGGTGMARAEGVKRALFPPGKPADSPALTQGMKVFPAAGNELVSISLMAHIPYQTIPGGIKDIMEGQGQLHHPKAGSQMTSHFGDRPDNLFPYLLGQRSQVGDAHLAQVRGTMDLLE